MGISGMLVTLLPPDADQDPAMARLLSDSKTMQYLEFMMRPGGYSTSDARARREDRARRQLGGEVLDYAIAVRRSRIPEQIRGAVGEDEFLQPREIATDSGPIAMDEPYLVIGCCGLVDIDPRNCISNAGIILDARFWRSGASTEAIYLVLQHGFDVLGLHRIGIQTTESNTGMRGWMENVVGVAVECVRREVLRLGDGSFIDSWDYVVFDRDWAASVKRNLQARVAASAARLGLSAE
ncbi:hypothetical protein H4R19_000157 [Coemansia spiralis]|nr:hypothetical protein H4R19_000157 [Coemansia spiralis]